MTDGQKIVFGGEGDQEPELEAGDLIIVLDEKEHDVSLSDTNIRVHTLHTNNYRLFSSTTELLLLY